MTSKMKNIDETQVLFEERVGLCTITLSWILNL